MANGISGHGSYYLTLQDAERIIESLRQKYPDMTHWAEYGVNESANTEYAAPYTLDRRPDVVG
jgi:hypothetical protein